MKQLIELVVSLERTAGTEFTSLFVPFEAAKGSFLVNEGNIACRFWLLDKGIARLFSTRFGDDTTCNFFFPGEFFGLYYSSTLKLPSDFSIQLITDASGWYVPCSGLEQLKQRYPLANLIEQRIIGCYLAQSEMRELRLRSLDASEHYLYLHRHFPEYIRYIPLTFIASYLGISLGSLSRIRATAIMKQPRPIS